MARTGRRKRMLGGDSECAYCGKVPADTVDHVVPKCLFEAPLPLNMITVPACSQCNSAKARLDSFLRDFLVCAENLPPNRVADSIYAGPYRRAVNKKKSELWKAINSGTFDAFTTNNHLPDLGKFLSIPVGRGPLKDSITYIVRGLYYKHTHKRLPDDHLFLAGSWHDSDACIMALRYLQSYGPIGIAAIGEMGKFDVFSSFCAAWYNEDGIFAASIWGLVFYERTHIGCISVAKSQSRHINPRHLASF